MFNDLKSNKHIPVVSIDQKIDLPSTDSIIVDNRSVGFNAVKHLIDMGHKRIGHISGPLDFYNCQRRLEGYYSALDSANIKPEPNWIQTGLLSADAGYTCMRNLLNETNITAVFADNDQIGIGAIKAIKDMGLSVPEDIAVIGVDNIYVSTLISPSLSTINIPSYQMGLLAMRQILKRISGEISGPNETIVLNTQIIIRKSTNPERDDTWDLHGW